ncbi:outer membrane protein assembly factor BamE [Aestuariirhabdus litorea]|uniref:Outer membrane protein assembly factor BamE n=1 Tax=Aestuariirhabdus litorea TaxID=2528527 RepID=A0A3P3VKS8_9GAMM|nr:outer membrane protein assembly factor BamE [Aestuariirhabdus litorea]RRJ83335.1 outer membrane protein assembly factor BamE [Aestuariirhabdus litorea]RWW93494.1 outer membrane protein assembly factor BamE [Endozoicomonadaceae bacterium GTF-13]
MYNLLKQGLFGLTLATLAGCSGFPGVHKIDIHQGNVITQEMVDQLRPGMTERQVRFVMGTPLLVSTFNPNRWDYIYSTQRGGNERSQQILSIFFENGELRQLAGDYRPNSGISLTEQQQRQRTEELLQDLTEEQKAKGVDPAAASQEPREIGSPNIGTPQ